MVVLPTKMVKTIAFHDRKSEEDYEEDKDIAREVVYDLIDRRLGIKNDVLGILEDHGLVPSMPNPMDHPNPSKLHLKADRSYRIEEILLMLYAVGTMALLACRIEDGTRKKTVDVCENNEINVDLYQAEVEKTT